MRKIKAQEKYGALFDDVVYVIVSVHLYVDRRLLSVRLHSFMAVTPIPTLKEVLRLEYEADQVEYQPLLLDDDEEHPLPF